jgi:hypothetical protein
MSITSANAILMISVPDLFPAPRQIQQFAADDVHDVDPQEVAEIMMGVDGVMTAGFVFSPVRQGISLMADSPSIAFFDQWNAAQRQIADIYFANGSVQYPGAKLKYNLSRGVLTTFPPISDAKKVLQPRKFIITWNQIVPQLM